jgi:hypothetical protein
MVNYLLFLLGVIAAVQAGSCLSGAQSVSRMGRVSLRGSMGPRWLRLPPLVLNVPSP